MLRPFFQGFTKVPKILFQEKVDLPILRNIIINLVKYKFIIPLKSREIMD